MRFTSLRPTQPFISSFLHPSRPFSTSRTHFLATPPRSPKARAAERARNHALPTLKPRLPPSGAPSQAPSQESLPSSNAQPSEWPVQLLAASHASGALPLPPSEAVPLLEKFSGLVASRRATKRAVEKLCQGDYAVYLDYSTSPKTLFFLATALLTANDKTYYPVLRELLIAASSLGDEESTKLLIAQALDSNKLQLPKIAAARTQLAKIVDLGDPTAMMLQAETDLREGRDEKAMELSEKIVNMERDNYTDMQGLESARGRSLAIIAAVKRKNKDSEGAKQALEKAALENDEPGAYLELALFHRYPSDPDYLPYLLKAAASDNSDAASILGGYYITQAWNLQLMKSQYDIFVSRAKVPYSGLKYSLAELYRLSEEWLSVAVDRPGPVYGNRSQVQLALLLRKRGEYEKGSALVGKAIESGDFGRCVGPWVMEHWRSEKDDVAMSQGIWEVWNESLRKLPKR